MATCLGVSLWNGKMKNENAIENSRPLVPMRLFSDVYRSFTTLFCWRATTSSSQRPSTDHLIVGWLHFWLKHFQGLARILFQSRFRRSVEYGSVITYPKRSLSRNPVENRFSEFLSDRNGVVWYLQRQYHGRFFRRVLHYVFLFNMIHRNVHFAQVYWYKSPFHSS